MKRKKQTNTPPKAAARYDHLGSGSDFYSSGAPVEQPLHQKKSSTLASGILKTGRHQAVAGRKKESVDPREKMALVAILKSLIMIILLVIAFFMLWKGIKIYEESVFRKTAGEEELSPVLREVVLVEEFDVESQESRELFVERIEVWKETSRLVRSADGLLARNNYDQAIERCQDALRLNPTHMGALERLGLLYFQKGLYVEAINSYIRLLSVDPSRADLQEKVIQALDAYQDADAVAYMCKWYLDENPYNENVQRYLANSLFMKEQFAEAAESYNRVLKDNPGDVEALERQAMAYMYLEDYESALQDFEQLRASNYRDPNYYRSIAVCHAQLGQGQETVQTLGKAAHLFGQKVVVGWVQDPRFDPIREDRSFQSFADRVGGEEFRKWLEKVAKTMDGEERKDITPQLTLPANEHIKPDLLRPTD
jgi:tetratricopeptide (TPR) repeat protein